MDSTIRREAKNSSITFWLDVSLDSLLARLRNVEKRPMLDKNNLRESINKIYSERKKIYNKSDFRIKCDSINANQIIEKIIKIYENTKNKF